MSPSRLNRFFSSYKFKLQLKQDLCGERQRYCWGGKQEKKAGLYGGGRVAGMWTSSTRRIVRESPFIAWATELEKESCKRTWQAHRR
jgi:hypothetical protein